MRKLLPLLLCLSLSIFTLARAMKPTNTVGAGKESTRMLPTRQSADVKTLFKHPNTEDETGSSDNDNSQDASEDDGEGVNDDDGGDAGDATADQDTADDNGADDDAGDDGGDNGGQ